MQLLTHGTGEYETQRVRHPAISVDVFVAVDDICMLLSKKFNSSSDVATFSFTISVSFTYIYL